MALSGKGNPFILLPALLVLHFPLSLAAADDVWQSVFTYQQKMANYGKAEAQLKLGEMYEEGHGTVQDFDSAQYWYQQALKQGDAGAEERLKKLQLRRQLASEALQAQQQAEQQRLQREQAERERQAQQRRQQEQVERQASEDELAQGRSKEVAQAAAEQLARKRAEEEIKKMLATPGGYEQ